MSRDGRKPWEVPVQYNEDRFEPPTRPARPAPRYEESGDFDERDARDVEEILRRPDRPADDREYECNDTTPINYGRGPHDEEFGVDENEFDHADPVQVDYGQGPHDEEYGVEDDDDFERLGDEPEFDDEV